MRPAANRLSLLLLCLFIFDLDLRSASAQELEPRRWGHLPINSNFVGVGYGYTTGDVAFNPVLEIEDTTVDMHSVVMKYIRTFELFERTARLEFVPIYQDTRWKGLLRGEPRSASRTGFADPIIRFAINLLGAPPLEKDNYRQYRQKTESETIVGVGLPVHLPFGDYRSDKLLNIGQNRFLFRPQIGVTHKYHDWSLEITGSSWLFTKNDDFFGGSELETDPISTIQGHAVYTFQPGLWASAGVAFGSGAESKIDGERKGDQKENILWGLSLGAPLRKDLGIKLTYIANVSRSSSGTDSDSLVVSLSHSF